ncbi:MAG: hypothetical protein MI919_35255 [Holophagales bacterium]|nr:hypothetical protein [Holophagales bacterium]
MSRFRSHYLAPAFLLLFFAVLPLMSGGATLYLRDISGSHLPGKTAQAQLLRDGGIPLIDPFRSGGQPLLGNPNGLPLYPTNLLLLVADPLWAMNAHFWLHWLLAPFAMAWLGRSLGLGRRAAWAAGVIYATSGYFLSQLNLYNLVTGATLVPAFLAACIGAMGAGETSAEAVRAPERRWRKAALAGLLWTLSILGGDPMTAALALTMAASTVLLCAAREREPVDRGARGMGSRWAPLAVCLGLGTLLTAPMLVEFWRILALSYRGYASYSVESALAQSWDPRTALEWLVPLVFGSVDHSFWGRRFFGGNPPFFFSLYPGTLALALVLTSGRPGKGPGGRVRAWAWGWIALGAFLALGYHNPLVRAAHGLPGLDSLRYPIKIWIAVAIAASLLCGFGFERLMRAGRRLRLLYLGFVLAYALAWVALLRLPSAVEATFRQLTGPLPDSFLHAERLRILGLLFFVLLAAIASLLVLLLARRGGSATAGRRRLSLGSAGALLLLVHAASQLFLLQPLYDTDEATHHTRAPEALALVPPGSRVVDGSFGDTFGRQTLPEGYPDARFVWRLRERSASLDPLTGIRFGLRYELNRSPEGLGSFHSVALSRRMSSLEDPARVRVLAASGADVLLLHRPLDSVDPDEARLEGTVDTGVRTLHVYSLGRSAEPYQLAADLRSAGDMESALGILTSPGFDPRRTAVVPSGKAAFPPRAEALPSTGTGSVEIVSEGVEEAVREVASPGGGMLTTERAWLAIYRASVDGEEAEPVVVNLHKLGVPVPPGEHRVRIWVDRRPTRVAYGTAGLALLGLTFAALGRASWRRPGARSE